MLIRSLWPAGIPSSPPGTVEWAGGALSEETLLLLTETGALQE